MAWQGYKDIQTSKYPHMALDLDVWDVVHSGDTLTFKATVRAKVTSGNLYYNGVSVSLTGGGSISRNMNPVSTGQSVDFGTFSCSIGVPSSSTSCDVIASLNAGTVASGSAKWTLTFGQGGSTPSGATPVYNSSTWDSVNATARVSSWGGATPIRLEGIVVTGSSDSDFNTITSGNWATKGRHTYWRNTSAMAETFNMTNSNITRDFDNPISLVGMRRYYVACWAVNSVGGVGNIDMTVRYLPPAPGQLSYQEPESGNIYTVNYVGAPANNNPDYDPSWLTRTVRYKVGSGDWTYIENDAVVALDAVTTSLVIIPASSSAVVEAWMVYHGEQSEVSSVTIVNSDSPVKIYGSVNGEATMVNKIDCPVNDLSASVVKVYASVEGVARRVFEDTSS